MGMTGYEEGTAILFFIFLFAWLNTTGKNLPNRSVHASHRSDHELQLKNYNGLCRCNACKRPASGFIYRCELCNFNVHTDCMFPKPTAEHKFFKGDTFVFLPELPGNCRCRDCYRYCEACSQPVKGSVYHCKQSVLNLHPCCFNIRSELKFIDVEFELNDVKSREKCVWCQHKRLKGSVTDNSGWSYSSKCKNYWCHASCMTEMIRITVADPNSKNGLVPYTLKEIIGSRKKRNQWKGNKFVKIAKTIFPVLVSIFIGDPTTILISLVLGLISNCH